LRPDNRNEDLSGAPDEGEEGFAVEEKRTGDKEKRSNLGRGLAALFGDTGPPSDTPGADSPRGQHSVPLEHIHPNPRQPRQRFDQEDLAQLADSIRENGVIQPIIVRHHPDRNGEYEIVAGERRWRAAQLAQLHQIPALVRDISDVKVLEIALLENIQRADLTPIEEAQGYRRLMDEFSYTQANLAQSLGKSRSHIANALRLLTLPEKVRSLLDEGALTAGHARALIGAPDPAALARRIVAEGLSVRQAEAFAQHAKPAAKANKGTDTGGGSGSARATGTGKDADTLALENDLSARLGLKVAIDVRGNDGERGRLTIEYRTLEQLDDLLRRLSHAPEGDAGFD
jgi:ParB family chromosome partitioning protein